jgi:4-aminobutyrate aminotransferase-like enzyme
MFAVGLFLGFEMVRDPDTLEPAADEAQALVDFMRDRGVLMSTDGPLHNVIKIKPPMVLNEEDVEITLSLLDEGLTSL